MNSHFCPPDGDNSAPSLWNEFKWLHFVPPTSSSICFLIFLSSTTPSHLLSSSHKSQVAKGQEERDGGKETKCNADPFSSHCSPDSIGNHIISFCCLTLFTRSSQGLPLAPGPCIMFVSILQMIGFLC